MVIPLRNAAKIEALFSRHGDAWRLYVRGWVAPYLNQQLDRYGEAFPVGPPDAKDLHNFMWQLDAPYVEQRTALGGLAIEAKGRSVVALWEWLYEHVATTELER
jgi:hypothetical protein